MAEKSLNDLPRDLRGLFTKGSDALQRDIVDYAIDLFNQILVREPAQYEVRKALRTAVDHKGPVYLRVSRPPAPIFTADDAPFVLGKANRLRDGGDVTIIAIGLMVYQSLLAA